ncbi:hypothetical protein [Haloglycomyces albus]|uniref:hypothetical protein n=1 Tax=Haloglycomyces albus TaxID=526067 RepID=UPI0004B0FFCE|nr:hypothetical protein [Haloglycomyces albus]
MTTTMNLSINPENPIDWTLIDDRDRLWGGAITGGVASGKTTLLRRIITGASDAGIQVSAIRGASDPFTQIHQILDEAREAIDQNRDAMGGTNPPTRRLVCIDDAPVLTDDRDSFRKLSAIAGLGQSVGVAVVYTLQRAYSTGTNLDPSQMGNVIGLNITDPTNRFLLSANPQRNRYGVHIAPMTGTRTFFDAADVIAGLRTT